MKEKSALSEAKIVWALPRLVLPPFSTWIFLFKDGKVSFLKLGLSFFSILPNELGMPTLHEGHSAMDKALASVAWQTYPTNEHRCLSTTSNRPKYRDIWLISEPNRRNKKVATLYLLSRQSCLDGILFYSMALNPQPCTTKTTQELPLSNPLQPD